MAGWKKQMAKNLEISYLLDFYGDMLTEKQRDVIEYYYNEDLSLSEIAENLGISRQGVRDAIKRSETQLLEMEKRLGLLARFRQMRDGLEKIREAAEKIENYNSRVSYSREIYDNIRLIEEIADQLCE